MKIIIPGGNGQVGRMLTNVFTRDGHECVVLTRKPAPPKQNDPGLREVHWDGRTLGPWTVELEGADVVINLAGRSVDCRYHESNLREMMASRVDSTRVIGQAIAQANNPPRVWLQASTATIYAHRYEAPNDEETGIIGGHELGVPALWARSIDIAQAWEAELNAAPTPRTRKVALRAAMVMSTARLGVFHILARHCQLGFGRFGDGRQYVSWIHEHDFVAAVKFLIEREDLTGAFNLAAPDPQPNRDFLAVLRRQLGRRLAIPVPVWALELGTFFLRTETELILKSRRVIPTRLLKNGFMFRYPDWIAAATELAERWRNATPDVMKMSTGVRIILFELIGPPLFGAMLWMVRLSFSKVDSTGPAEWWAAPLIVVAYLPLFFLYALFLAGPLSLIYMLLMEAWFRFVLKPHNWMTVVISTFLGRAAGHGIQLYTKFGEDAFILTGTIVGFVLGLFIKLFSPKPTPAKGAKP